MRERCLGIKGGWVRVVLEYNWALGCEWNLLNGSYIVQLHSGIFFFDKKPT